ncbi:MAG: two-component sensor histidine kinase, partial [Gemmatimonadales bacterium]|nr:two-component sensor histidine kinase [Gemmatimonadales bacterium]
RLAAALGRERAFTADVGHELRTPLAGARTTLEVALSKPRDPDEYREALNDCLAIVTRMHAMVESLLLLSRLESGQMTQRRELVRLARAVD